MVCVGQFVAPPMLPAEALWVPSRPLQVPAIVAFTATRDGTRLDSDGRRLFRHPCGTDSGSLIGAARFVSRYDAQVVECDSRPSSKDSLTSTSRGVGSHRPRRSSTTRSGRDPNAAGLRPADRGGRNAHPPPCPPIHSPRLMRPHRPDRGDRRDCDRRPGELCHHRQRLLRHERQRRRWGNPVQRNLHRHRQRRARQERDDLSHVRQRQFGDRGRSTRRRHQRQQQHRQRLPGALL